MSRWFRLDDDIINDPKILLLPEAMRWIWVAFLCIASKNDGTLPAIEIVALSLRVKPTKAAEYLTRLVRAGLVDNIDGIKFAPHNWNARQFKSDDKPVGGGKDSYVYFIGKNWGSVLKIGFSKNPWARIIELQTAQPDKLMVLATFRCRSVSEVDIHDVLREYRRSGGEWFDLPTKIYVAIHAAADRKSSYDELVGELRLLLRSATTHTEAHTDTERAEPDGSGADAPIDHRKRLFDEGLPKLARLTGKGPDACRSFVGKCLKASGDDAVTVIGLIDDAERNQVVDPSAWIAARLKGSSNGPSRIIQAADDLCQRIADFDGPKSELRSTSGENPPRLLSYR